MMFSTSGNERARINSTGQLLVGTTSPHTGGAFFVVNSGAQNIPAKFETTGSTSRIGFKDSGTSATFNVACGSAGEDFIIYTQNSERARIDSSGNLLVGKTTIGVGTSGSEIRADGQISIVREFATPLYINRKSSDGDVVDLRKDNTTFGTIGISSNNLIIKSVLDDKDIQFRGNDGGSAITALTLDMSDAGTAIFNHHVRLLDNGVAKFGNSQDFQIYHDGTNSAINNITGDLFIFGGEDDIRIRAKNDEESIVANPNGGVYIYHDGSPKLATVATGIDVTGTVVADGGTFDGDVTLTGASADIVFDKSDNALEFADNAKAKFGTGDDLSLIHI